MPPPGQLALMIAVVCLMGLCLWWLHDHDGDDL